MYFEEWEKEIKIVDYIWGQLSSNLYIRHRVHSISGSHPSRDLYMLQNNQKKKHDTHTRTERKRDSKQYHIHIAFLIMTRLHIYSHCYFYCCCYYSMVKANRCSRRCMRVFALSSLSLSLSVVSFHLVLLPINHVISPYIERVHIPNMWWLWACIRWCQDVWV